MSKTKGEKQYLKDIAPYDKAAGKFGAEASKWPNTVTDTTMYDEAKPVISALQNLQRDLLSQSWPKDARSDVRTLYTSVSPVIGDLESLQTIDLSGVSEWGSTFSRDGSVVASDANLVRHDLGLPLSAHS